jgi:large subunit ribosomal protein L4
MRTKVLDRAGQPLREVELAPSVFDMAVSRGAIYHAIRNEQANQRVGSASTKTRGEVHGSGTKPWRQKGTGRARAGHKRSPIWVGGGIALGAKPRDFRYRMPRKLKRLAIRSILTQAQREQRILVIEDITVDSGKTRDFVAVLGKVVPDAQRTTLVYASDDPLLKRAGRNVPWLQMLSCERLEARHLFYSRHLVLLESAARRLNALYGGDGEEATSGGT